MEKVFPRSTASWNELARIFAYDRTLSPDVREAGIGNVDGIIIHDISYAGFSQERIQAFLVEPMGEAPGQELCLFIPGRETGRHFWTRQNTWHEGVHPAF